ncbi:MAG: family 10 glycosylhydrolase [Woronichinia naegeliana WA131]|uniref:Family 10 glycosylhydrolase n=1 Tax=Woronichinia naegeliana WA131 TaxID=2824559 RepID=A0A977L0G3_9CYAN|nr:MAG: family 10 glycosylhydrolase [Woronichinia naegeliana WA131]
MLTLKIIQDTFAKLSTKPANTLSDSQKLFINVGNEGKDLGIKSYIKQGNHILVQLQEPLGSLGKSIFFFADHIQVEEIRGVWLTSIDSDILFSKDNIQTGLTKLKESGFNTLYPVVWNNGFVFFRSTVADNTVNADVANLHSANLQQLLAGRDILAEIIEINQDLGKPFRIIPWLEYGLMVPPNSSLAKNKPAWLMETNTGGKIVNGNAWLNPTHPEVQGFFKSLIGELVQDYAIDGIQLDDHFGLPKDIGFDDFTIALFKSKNPGAANPISNPNSEKFKVWRKSKVTELLRLIFNTVKGIKKDCIVSVSPNPLAFSIDNFLADWQAWEQEGIAEEIVLQVYRPSLSAFNGEIIKTEVEIARKHIPTVIGILSGLNGKRVHLDLIRSQTQSTRDRDFAGYSYFFYGSLFDLGADGDTPESRQAEFATLLASDRFV